MRSLLLALLFVFSTSLISIANNENIKEWTLKYSGFTSNESFSLEDSSKILHYKNKGTWEDTMGNFGTQTCFGLVLLEKNNNIISMEIYCELQDQDNDKFYTKVTRDNSLDAGVVNIYWLMVAVNGRVWLSPSVNMPSSTKKKRYL